MEAKSIMKGFITHKQVSEAKTYSKLDGPTMWQKKQVVKLYLKLITGVTFSGNFDENEGLEDFYQMAKQYFLYESEI